MQSSWLPFKHSWPSRALLLAEVVIPWGEHHLILIVRLAVRTAAMTSREYHWGSNRDTTEPQIPGPRPGAGQRSAMLID